MKKELQFIQNITYRNNSKWIVDSRRKDRIKVLWSWVKQRILRYTPKLYS